MPRRGRPGRARGFPNLLDDDWLWGGTLDEIQQTITHGIRYDADSDTRFSQMPAFGEVLEPAQIDDLVQYVLQISGQDSDATQATAGKELFWKTAPPVTARTARARRSSARRT